MPSTQEMMNRKSIKALATKIMKYRQGYFTPNVNGVTYGFDVLRDGCEIGDWSSEVDDPRTETFKTIEESIEKFIVDGKPLCECVSDAVSVAET